MNLFDAQHITTCENDKKVNEGGEGREEEKGKRRISGSKTPGLLSNPSFKLPLYHQSN